MDEIVTSSVTQLEAETGILSDTHQQAIENIKLARDLLEKVGNVVNPEKQQSDFDNIMLLLKNSESVIKEYQLFMAYMITHPHVYLPQEALTRMEFFGNVWNGDMYGVDKEEAIAELLKDLKNDHNQLKQLKQL